jgi:hypothetical protein
VGPPTSQPRLVSAKQNTDRYGALGQRLFEGCARRGGSTSNWCSRALYERKAARLLAALERWLPAEALDAPQAASSPG